MHETTTDELQALRKDLSQLREDFSSLLSQVKRETGQRWSSTVGRVRGRVVRDVEDARQTMQEAAVRGREAVGLAQDWVGRRPLTSAMAAFAMGAMIGRLAGWRRR